MKLNLIFNNQKEITDDLFFSHRDKEAFIKKISNKDLNDLSYKELEKMAEILHTEYGIKFANEDEEKNSKQEEAPKKVESTTKYDAYTWLDYWFGIAGSNSSLVQNGILKKFSDVYIKNMQSYLNKKNNMYENYVNSLTYNPNKKETSSEEGKKNFEVYKQHVEEELKNIKDNTEPEQIKNFIRQSSLTSDQQQKEELQNVLNSKDINYIESYIVGLWYKVQDKENIERILNVAKLYTNPEEKIELFHKFINENILGRTSTISEKNEEKNIEIERLIEEEKNRKIKELENKFNDIKDKLDGANLPSGEKAEGYLAGPNGEGTLTGDQASAGSSTMSAEDKNYLFKEQANQAKLNPNIDNTLKLQEEIKNKNELILENNKDLYEKGIEIEQINSQLEIDKSKPIEEQLPKENIDKLYANLIELSQNYNKIKENIVNLKKEIKMLQSNLDNSGINAIRNINQGTKQTKETESLRRQYYKIEEKLVEIKNKNTLPEKILELLNIDKNDFYPKNKSKIELSNILVKENLDEMDISELVNIKNALYATKLNNLIEADLMLSTQEIVGDTLTTTINGIFKGYSDYIEPLYTEVNSISKKFNSLEENKKEIDYINTLASLLQNTEKTPKKIGVASSRLIDILPKLKEFELDPNLSFLFDPSFNENVINISLGSPLHNEIKNAIKYILYDINKDKKIDSLNILQERLQILERAIENFEKSDDNKLEGFTTLSTAIKNLTNTNDKNTVGSVAKFKKMLDNFKDIPEFTRWMGDQHINKLYKYVTRQTNSNLQTSLGEVQNNILTPLSTFSTLLTAAKSETGKNKKNTSKDKEDTSKNKEENFNLKTEVDNRIDAILTDYRQNFGGENLGVNSDEVLSASAQAHVDQESGKHTKGIIRAVGSPEASYNDYFNNTNNRYKLDKQNDNPKGESERNKNINESISSEEGRESLLAYGKQKRTTSQLALEDYGYYDFLTVWQKLITSCADSMNGVLTSKEDTDNLNNTYGNNYPYQPKFESYFAIKQTKISKNYIPQSKKILSEMSPREQAAYRIIEKKRWDPYNGGTSSLGNVQGKDPNILRNLDIINKYLQVVQESQQVELFSYRNSADLFNNLIKKINILIYKNENGPIDPMIIEENNVEKYNKKADLINIFNDINSTFLTSQPDIESLLSFIKPDNTIAIKNKVINTQTNLIVKTITEELNKSNNDFTIFKTNYINRAINRGKSSQEAEQLFSNLIEHLKLDSMNKLNSYKDTLFELINFNNKFTGIKEKNIDLALKLKFKLTYNVPLASEEKEAINTQFRIG